MDKITDEAAFRVCASAKLVDQNGNGAMNYIVAPYLIDDLRSALSAAPALTAGEREPVATVARVGAGGMTWLTPYPVDALDALTVGTKLYTSPTASELEALRKERDELKRDQEHLTGLLETQVKLKRSAEVRLAEAEADTLAAEAELRIVQKDRDRLGTRVAEMEKALEPFADQHVHETYYDDAHVDCFFTAGQFRAARRIRDGGQKDG